MLTSPSSYVSSNVADAHDVAVAHAGPVERALDAHPPQPLLHVGHRFGVGEVGERDRALRGPARDAPRVAALAHDREALLLGAQHDVRLGLAFGGARLVDELGDFGRGARRARRA